MPFTLPVTFHFGPGKTGLATVGYQLKTLAGVNVGSRVTAGIVETQANSGSYTASVSILDGFVPGVIVADTGDAEIKYIVGTITPDYVTTRGLALPELAAGVPAATPTLEQAVMLLYMALRNRLDTTSATMKVYNDAGAVIAQATLSDDLTTFTRGELGAPS